MPEKSNPAAGARGARFDTSADGIAEHIPPLLNSQQPADPALIRVIARAVPWPDLKARPDRAGLRLRWDALREDTGVILVAGTEYPLADAAHALATRGASGATLVTMRHHGVPHDSFLPMALRIPAAVGAKRAEGRARIAALRTTGCEETAAEGAADPEAPATAQAASLSIPNELQRDAEGRR